MCKKDGFVKCLYSLLFLLGGLLFVTWVCALIWGIESIKGPCVSEYWNGKDVVYVDSNRFCCLEKETEGYYTTVNCRPTINDTCVLCGKKWSKHKQTQHTRQEIEDAFTEPLLPY